MQKTMLDTATTVTHPRLLDDLNPGTPGTPGLAEQDQARAKLESAYELVRVMREWGRANNLANAELTPTIKHALSVHRDDLELPRD